MRGNVRAAVASAAVAVALTATAGAAAAAPLIHAHRGGTVVSGRPTYTEESLDAYRAAARDGFVLEVDAKLTADGVPVAIHDATLDRTTNCTGAVVARTEEALRACRPDVLGSPGGGLRTRAVSPRGRIATIAEVLELARLTGATVNLEIKNLPTDPDWDPTTAYANRVMDVVLESGLPRSQLLIQSFLPGNLDVAKRRLRGVPTSFLTLGADPANIEPARDAGYTWISPQWPFAASYVRQAHRLDRPVAAYTLNARSDVRGAARAGVDALITDDPWMAARALGLRRPRALRASFARRGGRVEVAARLVLPRGVTRRRGCRGVVTLRVLGANRIVQRRRAGLGADCRVSLQVPVPRGATARLLATAGFGGNAALLPRVVGPVAVARRVPRAVPR